MSSILIWAVCGALGFGIVWTLLGARETDRKINQSRSDDDGEAE
jgi:hypothetical protein